MQSSSYHYLPLAPLFFWGLVLLFGLLIAMVQIGILGYAYEKMGISRRAAYTLLFLTLVGSYVNLPLAELPAQQVVTTREVVDFWQHYRVPVVEQWPGTVLAINVGGAVIPTLLSIYLLVKNQIYGPALLGVAIVTAVVHWMAKPIPHMGISVPIFIPPIISALVAMTLSRDYAAPLAYISGCMGTLIGADLLNLGELARLGASVASIGGAGTFDGVFLTGILAVLLAARPSESHVEPPDIRPQYRAPRPDGPEPFTRHSDLP
jgi:uncharacterized membrane protein